MSEETASGNNTASPEERVEKALSRIFSICDQRREERRKAKFSARERGESEHFWWDEVFTDEV